MQFIFYVFANNEQELSDKITSMMELFFSNKKWTHNLTKVEQVQQEHTKKQPTQVLFQVTVEVFSSGLKDALVSARIVRVFKRGLKTSLISVRIIYQNQQNQEDQTGVN
jgi:hypothetical protein